MNFRDALDDPNLFGSDFGGASWLSWRTIWAATFALPPREGDLERFQALSGRKEWPAEPASQLIVVGGRRGGKSKNTAAAATYIATCRDYSKVLSRGERGVVMCLAADRAQARVMLRYIRATLHDVPMLRRMIERETAETIDLTNGISIEVHTCSYRSVRGRTVVAALCDEISVWRSDESASPDVEVISALKPAMSTVPDSLLIAISSPYARKGYLWSAYREFFGTDDPHTLVIKATTRELNPLVPQSVIDRALAEDEPRARAEYLAIFRSDIEAFISREAVDACVVPERRELPPVEGVRYYAHIDPSGGSADSMTLCVGHEEKRNGTRWAVLDLAREVKPPFAPTQVVAEFAADLRRYRVTEARSDRYAAEWTAEAFRKVGIQLKPADFTTSELYQELLPALNSQSVELLDHPKLVAQLVGLERRVSRGGRETIGHAPSAGAHDDLACACAGVVKLVLAKRGMGWEELYGNGGLYYDENGNPRSGGGGSLPRGVMG
jgi:hypothetical protein